MQCFKVFPANELFHVFDIKFTDPVIEVSDPKNHTKVGSTKMKRRANTNTVSQAYQNNLYLKKENIYGFILMLQDSMWWRGRVRLTECNTSANIFEILIAPLIFFNVGS